MFQLDPAKETVLSKHLKVAELYASAPPKNGVFVPPVDYPTHERCVEIEVDLGLGDAGATVLGNVGQLIELIAVNPAGADLPAWDGPLYTAEVNPRPTGR